MEGPRAGIGNVEQHVNQLEQRLEDCLAHKANCADVPTNSQVAAAGIPVCMCVGVCRCLSTSQSPFC